MHEKISFQLSGDNISAAYIDYPTCPISLDRNLKKEAEIRKVLNKLKNKKAPGINDRNRQ
jgi:hypothetical protein